MYVKIGKPPTWIGPYQIADLLQKVGVAEDTCYEVGNWLNTKTPVGKLCSWIYKKRDQTRLVRVDPWDSWGADTTLAVVALPLLKQVQALKVGASKVDDADVPEELRTTSATPLTAAQLEQGDLDEFWVARWNWVMSEVVWAFEQWQPGNDWETQFHKGCKKWCEVKSDTPELNPATGKMEFQHLLEPSNSDSREFDHKAHAVYRDRIYNGFRLFGRYFPNMWE